MRLLERSKKKIYYKTYVETKEIVDENGYLTGEKEDIYSDFKEEKVSISVTKSQDSFEPFGTSLVYDHTMYSDNLNCEIDEHSILWIDNPLENSNNYIVVKKATSLNHLIYAIRKID